MSLGNQTPPIAERDGVTADGVQVGKDELATADSTAPIEPPDLAVGWLRRQPVLASLLATNIPLLIGFINELSSKSTSEATVAIIGVGILLLNVALLAARQAVTPVADPKLDSEVALVPAETR